jgi:hypothetical protein
LKSNYELLDELEKNCKGLGIDWHMIYEMTENFLKTGKHDSVMYPTFKTRKFSEDVLEIYDTLHGQYTIVMLFNLCKKRFFFITVADRIQMGPEQFNAFVEWFKQISMTS